MRRSVMESAKIKLRWRLFRAIRWKTLRPTATGSPGLPITQRWVSVYWRRPSGRPYDTPAGPPWQPGNGKGGRQPPTPTRSRPRPKCSPGTPKRGHQTTEGRCAVRGTCVRGGELGRSLVAVWHRAGWVGVVAELGWSVSIVWLRFGGCPEWTVTFGDLVGGSWQPFCSRWRVFHRGAWRIHPTNLILPDFVTDRQIGSVECPVLLPSGP